MAFVVSKNYKTNGFQEPGVLIHINQGLFKINCLLKNRLSNRFAIVIASI